MLAYLGIGVLYAAFTPAWQVPDEPAHYNYVRHLAEKGTLPVLEAGDYDQATLSRLTAERFPPELSIDAIEYEDHQPPLYYLLAVPFFWLKGGSLLSLRATSLVLGAVALAVTFRVVRRVLPNQPVLWLTATGFVAFVPQHLAMLAGANNDSLAELMLALTLLALLGYMSDRRLRNALGVGLLIGVGFLTKATIYFLPLVAAVAWFQPNPTPPRPPAPSPLGKEKGSRGEGVRSVSHALAMALPALALGSLWWIRNVVTYGWPDVLGLRRHNAIVVGQPQTVEWLTQMGWDEYLRRFAVTTFNSFWGQFGWMGVPMPSRVYLVLLAFTLLALLGFGLALAQRRGRSGMVGGPAGAGAVLAVTAACSLAMYLGYNLTFVQHQGRYLFTALIPLSIAVAIGLSALADWLPFGGRWRGLLPLVALPLLAALDLLALFNYILPALAMPSS